MSKYKTTVVEADSSPESIGKLCAVGHFRESTGKNETCALSGTVEEKLAQYKEFFGKDWPGTQASTFTELIPSDTPFVPLFGEYEVTSMLPPALIEAQKKIDALTALCEQYLREDKLIKEKKKLLAVRATMKEEEIIPA
jgi:hypothetical protein